MGDLVMKPDVIIYGLGKYFTDVCGKEKTLENFYNIVGYCDRDNSFERKYNDYIKPSELRTKSYDYILVTSIYYREIINDLVDKYNVSDSKILILEEEKRKKEYFNEQGTYFVSGQFGEDYVINHILMEKGIDRKNATYVEVGVDDPFVGNTTYFLHLSGASGILVDGNPESINLIRTVRKKQIVINKVINNERKDKVPFYISNFPALSSLSEENIKLNSGKVKEKIFVDTATINDILGMQDRTVVLSIDLEGYDKAALTSIDFELYQPEVICAEVGKPDDNLIKYMEEKGYIFYFCNYINSIWKRK
jgi:hypothetical protein